VVLLSDFKYTEILSPATKSATSKELIKASFLIPFPTADYRYTDFVPFFLISKSKAILLPSVNDTIAKILYLP